MNSYIRTIAKDTGKNSRFPEGNTERKIAVGKASKLQWTKFLYGQIQPRKGKRENAEGNNCALLLPFLPKNTIQYLHKNMVCKDDYNYDKGGNGKILIK